MYTDKKKMDFHSLCPKPISRFLLAILCVACFSSCSKNDRDTIDDIFSEKNFGTNRIESFDPKILNDDFLKTLKVVDSPFRNKLEPIGDASYFFSLQKISNEQIEFTTIDVFEEFKETYIFYRIMDRNFIQTASFPVAAIGGEGGSSVLGKGEFKDIHRYLYRVANHDESDGTDSLNILYTLINSGKIKIDRTYNKHK